MKYLLASLFIIVFQNFKAQTEKIDTNNRMPSIQSLHSLKLSILSISYTYEKALKNQFSINSELILSGSIGAETSKNNFQLFGATSSLISIEPRYYYNYLKRVNSNKKTINNSANFITLHTSYLFWSQNFKNILSKPKQSFDFIPEWGGKNALNNKFSIEYKIGLGITTENFVKFSSALGLGFKLCYKL